MIEMENDHLVRDGVKVGWVQGDRLYSYSTDKTVGYVDGNYVFDQNGKKIAEIAGEFVYNPRTGAKTRLEDAIAGVQISGLSDAMRVAIKLFFG